MEELHPAWTLSEFIDIRKQIYFDNNVDFTSNT